MTGPKNRKAAINRVPFRRYHDIASVVITHVDGNNVRFLAPRTGGAEGELECVWGDESVMWPYFPSTIPSAAASQPEDPGTGHGPGTPGLPPKVRAFGTLYLEGTFCSQNQIAPPPGADIVTPKWPDKLGDDLPSATLRVEPKKLELEGILVGSGEPVTASVNLLDPGHAPAQSLEIGDGAVQVRLTQEWFDDRQIPGTSSEPAIFSASHLRLTGIQLENGLRREGTVDLMDLALAPRRQRISLDGGPIEARLTRSGFKIFRVVFSPSE